MLRAKEKERRSSIVCRSKEKENYELIYERERRKTQCRLPKPEPNAEYQCRALLLAMGAGEADGGRRGRWGQARLVGAGEAGGGRRGQWGPQATGHMPEPASTEHLGSHRAKSLVNNLYGDGGCMRIYIRTRVMLLMSDRIYAYAYGRLYICPRYRSVNQSSHSSIQSNMRNTMNDKCLQSWILSHTSVQALCQFSNGAWPSWHLTIGPWLYNL